MKSISPSSYRPDIDGLRAIAVLAVIAFHANSNLVPGGFIGVDIFFVISGYLITGLIATAMDRGDFSFAEFYTRRIKRIFPAYIVVALVTLAISSYLLIPNDYIFYTTSLAASWAFMSNVFFSMLSWGYFGQRTEEFPLLHTWSLSVEEQF
jgi:peptidoglycan/LPS O-acetylase OafA/YrhL